MSNFTFEAATRGNILLRMALSGPPGCGKSYTMLVLATEIAKELGLWAETPFGRRLAIGTVDTENNSLSKYAPADGVPPGKGEFDFIRMKEPWEDYSPDAYVARIHAYEEYFKSTSPRGFILGIDSLSHAWMGRGGALEMVDRAAKKTKDNRFTAWRDVTPAHNRLVDALITCRGHLIVTTRAKVEYVLEDDPERPGKTRVRKVGMKSIQREGMDYEFDITGDMDTEENRLLIDKTRCSAIKGDIYDRPGRELARKIVSWLMGAAPKFLKDNPEEFKKILTAFEGLEKYRAGLFGAYSGNRALGDLTIDQARLLYRQMQAELKPPESQGTGAGEEPPPPPDEPSPDLSSEEAQISDNGQGPPPPVTALPPPPPRRLTHGDFTAEQIKTIMEATGAKNRAQLDAWLAKQAGTVDQVLACLEGAA